MASADDRLAPIILTPLSVFLTAERNRLREDAPSLQSFPSATAARSSPPADPLQCRWPCSAQAALVLALPSEFPRHESMRV